MDPIAIVGQGCVLPGALNPEALFSIVMEGRSVLSTRTWDLPAGIEGEIASGACGRVDGFDAVFRATGFHLPEEEILGLDPVFLWTLHAAREALAGLGDAHAKHPRGTVVLGNLSYPTPGLVKYTTDVWAGKQAQKRDLTARDRFMSGLPAQLAARALGFGGRAFSLDAACASSLFAIKIACDQLSSGEADIALAGGVNHTDDLFLALGFTALGALSKSGRSRPFHRDADGLVPAQGAAIVALKRLADAERDGNAILGVIRAVGLSNDGGRASLLVPSEDGQVRAMRAAYAASEISPRDISLVECHATGTQVGDLTELKSLARVFAGAPNLPIGSLKSNVGHLITASGAAALIKVLAAMKHGVLPPSRNVEEKLPELRGGSLRLLDAPEPWKTSGLRRAAISNFGFGGNNAHLIVEEWREASLPKRAPAKRTGDVAIVAKAIVIGSADTAGFEAAWLGSGAGTGERETRLADFSIDASATRTPPADLRDTLAQQLLLVRLAAELESTIARLPRAKTGVFVGMQCDTESVRHFPDVRQRSENGLGRMSAAACLGSMPNIVANRVGHQLGLEGASFTVSADEASGTIALDLAARALVARELDAAIVGAVDLSCEPVQEAALKTLLPAKVPADAGIMLVLKRFEDAERDGDSIVAVIPSDASAVPRDLIEVDASHVSAVFGHPHAASGLASVMAAISSCERAALRSEAGPAIPWLPTNRERAALVAIEALGGTKTVTTVKAHRPRGARASIRFLAFGGSSADDLRAAIARGEAWSGDRPADVRVALVAADDAELDSRRDAALKWLEGNEPLRGASAGDGIHFGAGPLEGEVAFVFTGPAGAYPRMGHDLALALPELVDRVGARTSLVRASAGWIYERETTFAPSVEEKMWGASFLAQLHAELTLGLLGIRADASIGYSSGETNALVAFRAWDDLDAFHAEITRSGLFTRELGGELRSLSRSLPAETTLGWKTFRVLAPAEDVLAAASSEEHVHVTIINGPRDVIIAGEPVATDRVCTKIGKSRTTPLEFDFVVHCPELRAFADGWRTLHRRKTTQPKGVRFYTHATCQSYALTDDGVADALLGQALGRVDFPKLIENAYADGVRVFVEHGPHAGCTKWIDAALGDRAHLAVALDRFGRSSLAQAVESIASLFAAGVPLDHRALMTRLGPVTPKSASAPASRPLMIQVPAHPPPVVFKDTASPASPAHAFTQMPAAPKLRSIRRPFASPALETHLETARHSTPSPRTRNPMLDRMTELARHNAALAEFHTAFLRRSAEVRAKFLATQAELAAAQFPAISAPKNVDITRTEPAQVEATSAVTLNRAELVTHATGKISDVLGPAFANQDGYRRQVRMPAPPLLLVDRVTRLEGAPGSMGLGTITTETDVKEDAWYMHAGRMPTGIFIESGQADLLLISWLGVDALNRDERVYRLLGCEITFFGPLPRAGETLSYEIHVEGHASHGDVRLFFFGYECRVNGELRLRVTHGQAGFFTDEELRASAGVLFSPDEDGEPEGHLDPPAAICDRSSLSREDVNAFVEGRLHDAFGPAFSRAMTHTRTPTIQRAPMLLLDEVTHLDPRGGPFGRGYARARLSLSPDAWFFEGHFKNDPCMPGTLMLEGGVQVLSLYLASLGFTLNRDGWRFELAHGRPYDLRCRGQATPTSKEVIYEIFVREVTAGACPMLVADLLVTVDGLKAFVARRLALSLVPGFPLEALAGASRGPEAKKTNVAFDHRALLACALGPPTEALGDAYAAFDGTRRAPRLPNPPYHFMTRVVRVDGEANVMKVGTKTSVDYDVPPDAWYFAENGARVMPFCVLLEIALQPCGWLTAFMGCVLDSAEDLSFRNLDGTGTVHAHVHEDVGTLTTTAELVSASRAGNVLLVVFDITVTAKNELICAFRSGCGFFNASMLENQAGVPNGDPSSLTNASDESFVIAERYADATKLPHSKLAMLHRVTGLWRTGGAKGLGRIRAERALRPSDWFFKAHFFQDPVKPGSLGIEAMLQALQLFMIETGAGKDFTDATFEPIASGVELTWKYRGQIIPENKLVVVDLEITSREEDETSVTVVADGILWVDGKAIYRATKLGMRLGMRIQNRVLMSSAG